MSRASDFPAPATTKPRFFLLYAAGWIPMALLYGALIHLQSTERDPVGSMLGALQSVITAALLGLPVWWLTTRMVERGTARWRAIAIHLLVAIAYAAAWGATILLTIALFAPQSVLDLYLRYAIGWQFFTGLVVYGMLAGIAHALTVGRRLRREREAVVRAEALRTRAELNALRAQMNPHFLFNTLHSIAALARSDPAAVERALEKLAALLRRMLNDAGADQVPLADEWEMVRDGLELEALRFGDRLTVDADIEPDALECLIPVFTLQPLVENAMRHGVAVRSQHCTVTIRARLRDDMLEIEVGDDGPGADQKATLAAPGLGLRAVRQRLMAQYGDRGGMHVETSPGRGFLVRVTLPASVAPAAPRERAPVAVLNS